MDLIFGRSLTDAAAAAFHKRIYASGGRQVDCVTVLFGVSFIGFVWFVVEGKLLTSGKAWNK